MVSRIALLNAPATPILNVSWYKFVAIDDVETLRSAVRERAVQAGVRGTVLLAREGINLFLAGPEGGLRAFLAWLRDHERFADMEAKESWSADLPFKRLIVKVKAEIIRMNCPTVNPAAGRAPAVSADTLARWLDSGRDDDGRPVVMLDTRNAFEIEHGGFTNALNWNISKFSEFPTALAQHKDELANKTVVSYCTGGIRCEKAALLMAEVGVQNVLQLDGGILKYLETQGASPAGKHYNGTCFVFDEREAVDATLAAAASDTEVNGAPLSARARARARALPSADAKDTR
ncbi:sulfurtransferase [soil metagenome]